MKKKKKNLIDHVPACNSLLKHNVNVPFLKQIVMGSESEYHMIMWIGEVVRQM